MNAKRVYIENQKYKEFYEHCVGIDYVQWDDDRDGYIYFEESVCGNRAEVYYKTLDDALKEYEEADEFFEIGKMDER